MSTSVQTPSYRDAVTVMSTPVSVLVTLAVLFLRQRISNVTVPLVPETVATWSGRKSKTAGPFSSTASASGAMLTGTARAAATAARRQKTRANSIVPWSKVA